MAFADSAGLPTAGDVRRLYDLSGKVALVTGGASGLCRAMAWGFACYGADIALVDRDARAAASCAEEMSAASGRRVLAYAAEASDERQVDAAVAAATSAFGRIDILVNGAGHNIRKPLVEFTQAEFDSLLHVHVRGAFLFCRAVGRAMQAQKSGSIINIASIAGHVGIREVAPYAAAKGALVQLTKAFALEMAPYAVRVNAIAPGYIDTPLTRQHPAETRRRIAAGTPLARFGEAAELIGPAVFLASDASSFVTGCSLVVDGGWTAQ
ncbi:MAG: glucose 1-dehydrogenase [Betaproteobacteria bacterium]|nr:glucose 1-dehydrogenase [Betaproteobacteria bacterium]